MRVFSVKECDREYRKKFSKAYRILYAPTHALCYLPEILDSAQEGFPYLWVNAEKYVFSANVLNSGRDLFAVAKDFPRFLTEAIAAFENSTSASDIQRLKSKVVEYMAKFDKAWTHFEQSYVFELMVIEADARRFIVEAIKIEEELQTKEQQKKRSKSEEARLREQFLLKIN